MKTIHLLGILEERKSTEGDNFKYQHVGVVRGNGKVVNYVKYSYIDQDGDVILVI